ncbi:hypothetical protein [Variovorax sp. GT1P44]|uniref:hypothetical protein n=1 Tax=Variovorax sp. GT1P44 TaxID=3443742 RepID=UPI003F45741B
MKAADRRITLARAKRLGAPAVSLFDWLETQRLPVEIARLDGVDVIRSLVAAGFEEADIPETIRRAGRIEQGPAIVRALTPAGRQWRRSP